MSKHTREPTRAEIFLDVFDYWRKHFKLPPLETKRDLRYDCHACIQVWLVADDYHEKGYTELIYNPRRLAKWSYALLVNTALHEIGHYKNQLPYDTFEQQVQSEYKAEAFAVMMMKKHYVKEFKELCAHVQNKNLGSKKWCKLWPIHAACYRKIKEYNTKD